MRWLRVYAMQCDVCVRPGARFFSIFWLFLEELELSRQDLNFQGRKLFSTSTRLTSVHQGHTSYGSQSVESKEARALISVELAGLLLLIQTTSMDYRLYQHIRALVGNLLFLTIRRRFVCVFKWITQNQRHGWNAFVAARSEINRCDLNGDDRYLATRIHIPQSIYINDAC